jgi:hypothetical protein
MIRLIVYVVVALLVLSFLGVSLQQLIENPTTQANFTFFLTLLEQGWDTLLAWLSSVADPVLAPITGLFD